MQSNFAAAMKNILKFEGGKDDDPQDPGGRTNQGIIQRVYTAWRIRNGKSARDVFLMEDSERDAIYKQNYFDKVRFDELPPGIDMLIVDGGVNSGPSQSIKWVQRALGLRADGVLGDITMQRIQDHPDHDKLVADTLNRRRLFLRGLKPYKRFGKGWESRVNQLQRIAQAWAMGSVGPKIVFVPNGNKKAMLTDAKALPSTAPADATASGGVVTSGISTAQGLLEPLGGRSNVIDQVLLALLVVGAIATAFGIAYGIYVRRQRNKLADALDIQEHYGEADNDNTPNDVVVQYADPTLRGVDTGNIAPGIVTQSGRVAGDTEKRGNSEAA